MKGRRAAAARKAIIAEYDRLIGEYDSHVISRSELDYVWEVVETETVPSPPFSLTTSYARLLRIACANVLDTLKPVKPRRDVRGRFMCRNHSCTVPYAQRVIDPEASYSWCDPVPRYVSSGKAEGALSRCTVCGKPKLWVRDPCGPLAIDCPELV